MDSTWQRRLTRRARSLRSLIPGALRYAGWRTLLVLLVLVINPFGSADGGDALSHRIWQTIHADQYAAHARARAIDHITVVTLDDVSMKAAAPPDIAPDSLHMLQIFQTLAQTDRATARPKALFIDLFLGDFAPDNETAASLLDSITATPPIACPERLSDDLSYDRAAVQSPFKCMLRGIARLTGYVDAAGKPGWVRKDDSSGQIDPACLQSELAKLDCILRAHGTPVMIATAINPADRRAAMPSAGAEALATVAISVPVLVQEYGYSLVYPTSSAARENRTFSVYPAGMLYAAWCAGRPGSCAKPPAQAPDETQARKTGSAWLDSWRWSASFDQPLDVTWGVGKQDTFINMTTATGSGPADAQCRFADERPFATAKAFLQAWFAGLGFERGTPCIYQHHLSYADLLRVLHEPGADNIRRDALTDKILLIGMATTEGNDFIAAGPHRKLPGVYYHAMALDNLIERGAGYSKMAYKIMPPLTITNQDCWNAVATFLMLLMAGMVHQRFRHRTTALRRPWRELGRAGAVIVLVAAYMFIVLYVLTGQISLLPDQFNMAALSIVLVAEVIHIAATVVAPMYRPLTASVLHDVAARIDREADALAVDEGSADHSTSRSPT